MTSCSQDDVERFFDAREAELVDPGKRLAITFDAAMRQAIPDSGGVYSVFREGIVVYVGETASLSKRLSVHMRNPENHVLTLKIARLLFDQTHGDGAAGSRRKFEEEDKAVARIWITDNLAVSFVSLLIGRKELEERLIRKEDPEFNKRHPVLV